MKSLTLGILSTVKKSYIEMEFCILFQVFINKRNMFHHPFTVFATFLYEYEKQVFLLDVESEI